MDNRKKLIGDRAFYGKVLGVTVPIMIQNGITNFVGLLDNIMVGRIGTEQMSGIAIVNQLLMVFNLAIFGALSGVGIFSAQFFGCRNHKGVQHTLRFKIYVGLGILVLGTIILMAGGERTYRRSAHNSAPRSPPPHRTPPSCTASAGSRLRSIMKRPWVFCFCSPCP